MALVVGAGACGDSPAAPTPPVVGPATPPIIRSITGPAARVEAGQDVTIAAVVEDAETPISQLSFLWTASAGAIVGTGPTAVWRHNGGITAGINVVVTLTVIDKYQAVEGNRIVEREFRVVSQAAPFRFHDSPVELKELARKFLLDLFGNSAIPPAACLVDFTETGRCAKGKARELEDITDNRQLVVIQSGKIYYQTVTFQGANEAVVVSYAEFHDVYRATGAPGFALGDFNLTAIYEFGRWWLCESTFDPVSGQGGLFDYYRKKQRGGFPNK